MTNGPTVLVLLDSIMSRNLAPPSSLENRAKRQSKARASVDNSPPEFHFLLDLACTIAADSGGDVRLISVIEAAPDESLSLSALAAQLRRSEIAGWTRVSAKALSEGLATGDDYTAGEHFSLPDIQPMVGVATSGGYWHEIRDIVQKQVCTLVIAAWTLSGAAIDGATVLQHDLACDILVVQPKLLPGEQSARAVAHHLRGVKALVPARGGPHARLAVQTAAALATQRKAEIALLHVMQQDLPERQRIREERPFAALLEQANLAETTRTIWAVSRSISDAILDQARDYDLLLLGAPALGPENEFSLGPVATAVLEQADATVIIVKTAAPAEPAIRALLQNPALDHDLSAEALSLIVDKWFAENTFNAEEYSDLDQLVRLKRQRGATISLGLPTLNEEATIGNIITTLKQALMDNVPLLDEIVVIDSGSTDKTRELAHSLGVPVVIHQDVLPEAGPPLHGKGEALWKSLDALKGDLIAWVDTDVTNMHPRFVYGLIGPLLHEPHLAYVKGYYHRPIKVGDKLEHEGGGRVTELTVRPLFNLFFPMLSGFVQPLAGEYAGRREALEQLPFFSGYGVETGLLIDLLGQYGLSAIGQVNLGERIHRNQSLSNLSLMAFSLVQVIINRLEEQARVHLIKDVNRSMKLIRFTPDQLSLDVRHLSDIERPPINTLLSYRSARASFLMQRTAQSAVSTRE